MTIAPDNANRFTATFPVPKTPVEAPSPGVWQEVEKQLSLNLPDDYKWFIEQYGTGCVSMFFWIFNPFSDNDNLNLVIQVRSLAAQYRALKQELGDEEVPYPIYPDNGGLVPFGASDNGDGFFWLAASRDPNRWGLVINEARSSVYESYDCSLTEFLVRLASGEITSEIFPEEFIERDKLFLPVSEVKY